MPDREQEARDTLAGMRARASQLREQAWERALERAVVAGARKHGHARGHHR